MATIVPTITTDNVAFFKQSIETFSKFSKRIQIDLSDGTFAPTVLVPISDMQFPEGLTIDFHVMSARPSEHLAEIIAAKPSLCILHAEVNDDLRVLYTELKKAGIKTGIALLKSTFPGRVRDLIAAVDHTMIFAGELGKQGGAIDLLQTEKVPLIRQIKPDTEIGWDGGVNLSNIRALAHDGLDVLNVGSAITNSDNPAAMYQSLFVESEKKGVLV